MRSRRFFLKSSVLSLFGLGALPLWLARAARLTDGPALRRKVLVAIFQRGAVDGLNMVVPFGDPYYYRLRPNLAIPPPADNSESAIDLDGYFGLHPSLAPLKRLFEDGHLAIVHAAGSPDPTRSHFDAQDYMESGTPGRKATNDGWLNRALPAFTAGTSPVQAVSLGATLARTLRGAHPAIALTSLDEFQVRDAQSAAAFESMYATVPDAAVNRAARETFEAVRLLQDVRNRPYRSRAAYPGGSFGRNLRQIAQLIHADVGLEVAFAEMGGWDTHVNQAGALPTGGQLAARLSEFGQALAAFCEDLGGRMADVVVVTMSEFGRTARENGNRGTDHGHGNVMLAIGGGVRGGKLYGEWPGLAAGQLHDGRDLSVTTDFRDVLGELLTRHLRAPSLDAIFPDYRPRFRDLLA